MKKVCFKCGKKKALKEFYKHPQMADGHLNKCIECAKKDITKNRNNNIDHYRKYDRKRGSRQPKGYLRKYRAENPEKYAAHMLLNTAIKSGKIKKQPCEKCGSTIRIHGHHDDYYKPLEIRWLCPGCHKKLHTES